MATTYTIQQRKKNQGIMTWYLRTCTDGKQRFESLHTTKKGEAVAILERMKTRLAMPELPGTGDRPVREMVKDWLQQCDVEFGNSGNNTYITYKYRIENWLKWCDRNNIILSSDFTPRMAVKYVGELASRLAPKTIHEIVKLIKKCLVWNIDTYGIRDLHPFKSVKTPKQKQGRVEFWTGEEVRKILDAAPNDGYRAFWALMAFAGLRFSEARNLRADFAKNGIIRIVNGKGGKDAEIPISAKLHEFIGPFLDSTVSGGLLIPKDKVPLRSDKAIVALKIAVGVSRIVGGEVSHHKLRHSFASELLRNGVNPKTVQDLMRHSSIDTLFRHYAHVLRSDLEKAVELL